MLCDKTENYLFHHYLYLSKKASNVNEVKGNVTFLTDYDDSFTVHILLNIKLLFYKILLCVL